MMLTSGIMSRSKGVGSRVHDPGKQESEALYSDFSDQGHYRNEEIDEKSMLRCRFVRVSK